MSKRKPAKQTSFNVPQTDEDADRMVARIGFLRRELEKIETRMNARLAAAKARAEEQAAPIKAELGPTEKGLHAWAEANRRRLTENHKTKTVKLPSGKLSWRLGPVKLKSISKAKLPEIIAALGKGKLRKYLRIKTELNREAMVTDEARAELAEVDGLGWKRDEFFDIEPFGARVEEPVNGG